MLNRELNNKYNKDVACIRCFRDKQLREYISENGKKSNCPWCGAKRVPVLPLEELGPLFRSVVQIYEPVEGEEAWGRGDNIGYLLQEDWGIFSNKTENDPDLMHDLAVAILEAGLHPKYDIDEPDYSDFFVRSQAWLEENWHEKIEQILEGRESFKFQDSQQEDITDRLEDFEAHEIALEDFGSELEEGKILFRARIHDDRTRIERFSLQELGAPSPKKSIQGRVNRKGEPVLYLASDEPTALAEIRAWKGAAVAIAKIRLRRCLRVVNLIPDFKIPASPFFEENLDWRMQLTGLFKRFGEELSRPIFKDEEDILYRPSQHLCDIIRQQGFKGVIYPSAMGEGYNVAIFDLEAYDVIEAKYVRVAKIIHDYKGLKEHEPIYEETPYDYYLSKKTK
jgi:hypothetical protein